MRPVAFHPVLVDRSPAVPYSQVWRLSHSVVRYGVSVCHSLPPAKATSRGQGTSYAVYVKPVRSRVSVSKARMPEDCETWSVLLSALRAIPDGAEAVGSEPTFWPWKL